MTIQSHKRSLLLQMQIGMTYFYSAPLIFLQHTFKKPISCSEKRDNY